MSDDKALLNRLLDEASIRNAIARFGDTAMMADYDGFRELWSDDAEWVIGKPHEMRVSGVDDIVALLKTLRTSRGEKFVHFAIPGVIVIDGDEAMTRCVINEAARGTGESHYRTHGIFFDRLRRSNNGWVFTNRTYHYIWLDSSAFSGDMFALSS